MKSHLIPVKDESGVWDSGILGLQEVPADASGNDLPGVQERRWNQAVPETVEDTGRGRRPLGLRAAASCSQPIGRQESGINTTRQDLLSGWVGNVSPAGFAHHSHGDSKGTLAGASVEPSDFDVTG